MKDCIKLALTVAVVVAFAFMAGCGGGHDIGDTGVDAVEDVAEDTNGDVAEDVARVRSFTIMTFNTGTTDNMDHSYDPDGYSNTLADLNAEYFGNNLAWLRARIGLRAIVSLMNPDIITFQELFFDPQCDEICEEILGLGEYPVVCDPTEGEFVCAKWVDASTSDLTVRAAVGPDYDVVCAPNHNDNCIAVRRGFGTIAHAPDAADVAGVWIDGLDGLPPPNDCTSGARVATGMVSITNGPEIAVVDVHTVAGTNVDCRLAQFQQVFDDRGDGKPATFGEYNIVLGDMNIDPFTFSDASVSYWNENVGAGKPFHYISSDSIDGPMTHPATFSKLDHVISDNMTGSCVVPGISDGTTAPISADSTYFDHRPVFCTVDIPE